MPAHRTTRESIWGRIQPDLNSGCWLWSGSCFRTGYGRLRVSGKTWAAHRYVYQECVEPIPAGAIIRHKCDTRPCVNPSRLVPGTHADNMADKAARGRCQDQRGDANPNVHLSDAEVETVREALANSGATQQQIADRYGVHQSTISRIRTGVLRNGGAK